MKRLFLCASLLLCLQSPGLAGTGPAFLRFVPDATAIGLGSATQALPLGPMDLFVNPALLDLNRGGLKVGLSNLIEYQLFQYGALVVNFPVSRLGTAGIGLLGLNYPDLSQYDRLGQFQGTFNQYNVALVLAFSRQMLPFSFGAGLKAVQMGFGGLEQGGTGRGYGLDLGFYFTPRQSLKLGVALHTSFTVSWSGGYQEKVPQNLQMGLFWQPHVLGHRLFSFVLGIDQTRDEPARLNGGLRLGFAPNEHSQPTLFLFGGINQLPLETRNQTLELGELTDAERTFTAGAELRIRHLWLSYAAWFHNQLNVRHLITTKFEL